MRKYLIAFSVLAALATTADAACTKKALNGTWAFGVGGQAALGTMSGGSIVVNYGGTPITFNIGSYSKSKCKGSGSSTINGTPLTSVKFATEQISSSSSRKPNHMIISAEVAPGVFYEFILTRR